MLHRALKINHFGVKPVSGGRPPSDMSVIIIIIISGGAYDHIVPISISVFVVVRFSIINIAVVIII